MLLAHALRYGAAAFVLLFANMASGAVVANIDPENVQITDAVIAQSLTGRSGDITAGRDIFVSRKLGNCLACHINSDLANHPFHGEIGPTLDGVAERWTQPQLRAILVNPKAVFGPETIMPAFYALDVGANVRNSLIGKTILSAEQIESLLAYLNTLH